MIHFHPLRIKDIRAETAEAVSVAFDIPDVLRKQFQFQQGQNITVKATINGEELRRSYSICTAPHEGELRIAIKQVAGGKFSTFANTRLKKGDVLDVMPPTGRFFVPLNPAHQKKYLAIAAGSGITPIISIIKATLHQEPKSHFTLVYSNRNRNSIIFFEALEGLKNQFLDRFTLINLLSRERTDAPVCFGRVSAAKLQELGKLIAFKAIDDTFICGPEAMTLAAKACLEELGIPSKRIHIELFAAPGQQAVRSVQAVVTDDSPKSRISIKSDGRSFEFDLAFDQEAILDAALKQGADLPFACKGGVCCTCRAKLVEGEVHMEVHYGLEHEEIEQGFILTCQARPVTEKVVVDFDVR
jgi:ring-1,2-phenylacetyl-CoA epoxidase subunit PaaE